MGCPIKLKPMKEWVGDPAQANCRPCTLGPVAQWYTDELRENKKGKLADEIEQVAENGSPEDVCEKLDEIKTKVEEPLRERLLDFDCAAQTNE